MLNKWLLIFFIFSFSQALFAEALFAEALFSESAIRVFQTQQPGQDLIPLIEPLYGKSAKFTANNYTLIVKAPPAIIQEIEQLLQQIDIPLHNLLIEIYSSLAANARFQQDSISGKLSDNEGTHIRTFHTRRNNSKDVPNVFTIRTLEGHWAFIEVGQKVPYYNNNSYSYADPLLGGVELVDVTSGFDVFPILNGQQVNLKVRPHNSSMNRERPKWIDTRSIETIVTGNVGQWIELGGAVNQANEQTDGINYSTKRYSELDTHYSIRVTIID